MKTQKKYNLFPAILSIYVGMFLVSNIVVNKQVSFGGYSFSCSVFAFPLTYILSDVFSEVYGYKWSRYSAWAAFIMNILAVGIYELTIILPGASWFENQLAFEAVLGNTFRILIASLIAFMCGDYVNDVVFKFMKKADKNNKRFILRAIVSSLCGELTDCIVFIPGAFLGSIPTGEMIKMIFSQAATKLVFETAFLPLTFSAVKYLRNHEKYLDIYLSV